MHNNNFPAALTGTHSAAEEIRGKDRVQSLERGLAVLTAFDAEHPTLNITEVAHRCGLPRSAARRFLHTLLDLGYLSLQRHRFELTPQVLELGYTYLGKVTATDIIRPHAQSLGRQLGTSVSVSVLDGTDIRYVLRVNPPSTLAMSIKVGSRVPAHRTGMGLVLLSAQTDEALEQYIQQASTATGERHLSKEQQAALWVTVARIRKQQWCYVDQLLERGIRAVAIPLRDQDGDVVAAMSASLYENVLNERQMISQLLPPLQEHAAKISLELRRGIEIFD